MFAIIYQSSIYQGGTHLAVSVDRDTAYLLIVQLVCAPGFRVKLAHPASTPETWMSRMRTLPALLTDTVQTATCSAPAERAARETCRALGSCR